LLDNVWLEYGLFGPSGGRVFIGLRESVAWNESVPRFDPVGGQGHIVVPKGDSDY
jgi:hypothetical protein